MLTMCVIVGAAVAAVVSPQWPYAWPLWIIGCVGLSAYRHRTLWTHRKHG